MSKMKYVLLSCLICLYAYAKGAAVKEFSIVIDKPEAEYQVDVGGGRDPENLEITIENLGDTPVVNPRMSINDLFDWYDAKSLASEITAGCQTDEEKALAIWWWVRYRTYQRSPRDESATNPVRALNGYGYGICGHVSAWMKCLWSAAGLQARVQELWGHTVSEVFYNGAWHMLDGNVKVFYLNRDNRTIADLKTLEHDKWLIERSVHPREMEPWFLGPDPPGRNEQFVHYITTYKDNYEEHSYDREITKNYSMAMTLKPGEKLVRWWTPKLAKYEARDQHPEVPEVYGNGQLIWEPDLKHVDIRPYLDLPNYANISTAPSDKQVPAIHVAELQDEEYTRPSVFSIPISSPYPIVGARFSCTLNKQGESGLDQASISFGHHGWDSADLYEYRWGRGPQNVSLDLDSKLKNSAPSYHYSIGFSIRGNGGSKPPTQSGLDAFRSETDLQVSPESLPALTVGKNTVHFRSQSSGPIKVKITHRWKENSEGPPNQVKSAADPVEGQEVATLTPVLKWTAAAADPSASVNDYQVMVSLRPDCRWPLSTTLHRNVGSNKTEWKVPATFLNPGTTYYWKVRARDSRGLVGEWSSPFHFRTSDKAK